MPKLSDEQLGGLLRETFADHRDDTKNLPVATKRRSFTPVLVAAAVLGVVTGSVYVVRATGPEPLQPAAIPGVTSSSSTPQPTSRRILIDDDTKVWSLAGRAIALQLKPAEGWQELSLQGLRDPKTGPEPVITRDQRRTVALMVADAGPVRWQSDKPLPGMDDCRPGNRIATIGLGKVVKVKDTRVVRVRLEQPCHRTYTATYTLKPDPSISPSKHTTWMIESVSDVVKTIG